MDNGEDAMDVEEAEEEVEAVPNEENKESKKKGRPAGAKNRATFGKSGEVRVRVRGLEFLLRWCDTVWGGGCIFF